MRWKVWIKETQEQSLFCQLKTTTKKSTFIDYQIVQVRKIQNLFSFPIAVLILYDVWTGKNRLGQYDKDSSPLKEKDEKKKFLGQKLLRHLYKYLQKQNFF